MKRKTVGGIGAALALLATAAIWVFGAGPTGTGGNTTADAPDENLKRGMVVAAAPGPAWRDAAPAAVFAPNESPKAGERRQRQLERALQVKVIEPLAQTNGTAWREGQKLTLALFDGEVEDAVIERVWPGGGGIDSEKISGRLVSGGSFAFAVDGRGLREGVILPGGEGPVYRILGAEDGGLRLAKMPRDAVLCASLPRPPSRPATASMPMPGAEPAVAAMTVPTLDSRPEAEPVLYLDFDGETVNDPIWNRGTTIQAAPSGLTEAEIRRVWSMVAEDYRPFRINVTTDPSRYAAARPMQRMRCIITPTNEWYGDVGGVALVFSWRDASAGAFAANVPCWVFSDPGVMLPEDVALAISHEAGHTLGLYHDGLRGENGVTPPDGDYYQGQGTGATAWGPIMGAPYGKPLIQWSRGDYSVGARMANNPEDDVALIATIENHVGFAAERRPETLADACRLGMASDGVTVDHKGLIERAGAEAWLIFATGGGALNLELAPVDPTVPTATNFDGTLTITTTAGTVLASADQTGTCYPRLTTSLAAGVYVLRVKSAGEGSPAAGGSSNYGSIGRYRLVGQIPAATGVAPQMGGAPRGEGRAGEAFGYTIEAAGSGLTFAADNLPPGLTVGADGRIGGVPSQPGQWTTTVRATNTAGASSRMVTLAVAGGDFAASLDAPGMVFTTGGSRSWRNVAEAGAPVGGSSARSGELLDDNGESWIETRVAGPGRISWLWRVSSEKDYDLLHASLDGTPVAAISGDIGWTERVIDIPAGTHVLRWSYDKDDYLSEREDSAWLDRVRWERGFEQWATASAIPSAAAAAEADPDGDGAPNLLEYAFGRSPGTPDGLGSAVTVTSAAASGGSTGVVLELTFTRPPGLGDIRYVTEVSSDLLAWTRGHAYGPSADNSSATLPTSEIERTALPDGSERIRVRDRNTAGDGRRFIRLRVERT